MAFTRFAVGLLVGAVVLLQGGQFLAEQVKDKSDLPVKPLNDMEKRLAELLKNERCLRRPKLPFTLYVKAANGLKLQEPIFISIRGENEKTNLVLRAEQGELQVDVANRKLLIWLHKCWISTNSDAGGFVEEKVFSIDLPAGVDF